MAPAAATRLLTTQASATIFNETVRGGFIACSPWFPAAIASFLNHQLSTLTNIATDGSQTAGSDTPQNSYEFEFDRGRFQLKRTGGSREFAVVGSGQADSAYQYLSMQLNTGAGDNGAATNTNTGTPTHCPNGYAGSRATLVAALGFASGAPARLRSDDGSFSVRAQVDGFSRLGSTTTGS